MSDAGMSADTRADLCALRDRLRDGGLITMGGLELFDELLGIETYRPEGGVRRASDADADGRA